MSPVEARFYPRFDLVRLGSEAPAPIVQKLNLEINKALQLPEVRNRIDPTGAEIVGGTAEEFGAMLNANMTKFKRIVSEAGIKPQNSCRNPHSSLIETNGSLPKVEIAG